MSQAGSLRGSGSGPGGSDLHVARYIVSAGGGTDGANYTTIASAYAAAVAKGGNQTVFIQPGTYTENITLSAGVNLAAFNCDALPPSVTINGKCSASFSGACAISGICLQTNGDYFIEVSGANATRVELIHCRLSATNNTGIHVTNSNGNGGLYIRYCNGQLANAAIAFFTLTSTAGIQFTGGIFENLGSTTVSTSSGNGGVSFYNCFIGWPVTTSSSGAFTALNCQFSFTSPSTLTIGNSGGSYLINSWVYTQSASAISVGAGASLKCANCAIDSTNTNAITGAGTLQYGLLTFTNSSSTVNTSTLIPLATLI